MKIKELCDKIIEIFEKDCEKLDTGVSVVGAVYDLRREMEASGISKDSLISILETAKKIALTQGKNKQILETELLKILVYLPFKLWRVEGAEKQTKLMRGKDTNDGQIAEELINFTKEIYVLKLNRDAFSGKRRGYAIQILESLSYFFEVPEFMELCSKSIKSKSRNEYLDTLDSLRNIYVEKNIPLSDEVFEVVDKRVGKAKKIVEARAGLVFLVDTGWIGEFEALDRLGDWKEKNYNW